MKTERRLQVLILLIIAAMAGAASFTHVHDWTMHNAPPGTGSWFGWANAIISELTPTAAGIEIRRRKRTHQPIAYPMAILIAAAILSLGAQVSQARPTIGGWLSSAVPALAFLALTKLVLSSPRNDPGPLSTDDQITRPRTRYESCHRTKPLAHDPSRVPDRRSDSRTRATCARSRPGSCSSAPAWPSSATSRKPAPRSHPANSPPGWTSRPRWRSQSSTTSTTTAPRRPSRKPTAPPQREPPVTPTSIPMLALAPGQAPGTGAGTRLSKDQPPARRLHPAASAIDRASEGWLITQTTAVRPATPADPGLENVTFPASAIRRDAYDAWLSHVWTAAACSRPVLLRGHVRYVDAATGEVTGTITTDDLPDQAIYKPCGNRRAASCPGCAETYRRDAFHLIRAGLAGGKGIPDTVTGHPVVFATFTAPSFGPVHTRPVRLHTCAGKQHCHCKPEPCHPRRDAGICPHGRPLACYRRHTPADARLGEPLCPDCYDYPAHVVWNAAAGELWRRTKQDIERHLIQLAVSRGYQQPGQILPPIRLSHGKAAEYQARGAVHFHTLLRLDGTSPRDPEAIVPPPPGITAADLEDAVRQAAANVSFTTKPHPDSPDGQGWHIAWGDQLDVRPVNGQGSAAVTGLAVASYLAKYATKGTEDTGHVSARITPDALDLYADPAGTHAERLISACWNIGHAQGRMCGKAIYDPCADGRTCSASAATSSPKPAATPSPSPPSDRPAWHTAVTTTPAPTTRQSSVKKKLTPNRRPSSSACPTPEPAGAPSETPSSPTPPPIKLGNDAKPDARNFPTNTSAQPISSLLPSDMRQN